MIIGLNSLILKLNKLASEDFQQELQISAQRVEDTAKQLCPVDTGNLRDSISHIVYTNGNAEIYTNVEYAPHVEYGTWKQRPQPFMEPAIRQETNNIITDFHNGIRRALR